MTSYDVDYVDDGNWYDDEDEGRGDREAQNERVPRLQKALAHAGVASRRACETLITSGRVTVNDEVVFEMGSRIDPDVDVVRVDEARSLLLVRGAVPGAKNGHVVVRPAVKATAKKPAARPE